MFEKLVNKLQIEREMRAHMEVKVGHKIEKPCHKHNLENYRDFSIGNNCKGHTGDWTQITYLVSAFNIIQVILYYPLERFWERTRARKLPLLGECYLSFF